MCAPADSTWSDPMFWRSIFAGMAVAGVYAGVRIAAELKIISNAMTAGPSAGQVVHRVLDEVQDTRLKLTSTIAMVATEVARVARKIEDLTAVERRKQNS